MSLVPFQPVSRPLQTLLYPILLADRHLQEMYFALDQLIEVEDYLEHTGGIALATLQRTIRYLRRAICHLSDHRMVLIAEFHHELRNHVRRFHQVPPMDLEM